MEGHGLTFTLGRGNELGKNKTVVVNACSSKLPIMLSYNLKRKFEFCSTDSSPFGKII